MKFFSKSKDGGPSSTVTGYFLVEIKNLFSIVLLKFDNKSRNAYHEHAFNCISWILKGRLIENFMDGTVIKHKPSIFPIVTKKETFHKVDSEGITWALSFRGPWSTTWKEYLPEEGKQYTLTNGRIKLNENES